MFDLLRNENKSESIVLLTQKQGILKMIRIE